MSAVPTSTPKLVLVHGYLDGPAVWRRLLDHLDGLAQAATCVRLTPIGDRTQSPAELLEAYARQVLAECTRSAGGEPIVLVGHSMGGAVAELAAAQGIRALTGLVLVTPSPLRGVPLPAEVMQRFATRAALTDRDEIRAGKRAMSVDLDAAAQELLATATLETGEAFALEQLRAWTGGHPQGLVPSRVDVPVQLVTTDDKFFTADLLRQEATRFRGATDCHVAGAGHWPQLEQPALLAAVVESFLARVTPPRQGAERLK
jgi:pimeloyl-ACP methyl ester carboxylesterase